MDIIERWRDAADKLGVALCPPSEIQLPNGMITRPNMLVPNFGARNGTLVFGGPVDNHHAKGERQPGDEDWEKERQGIREGGYYLSIFPPSSSYWTRIASEEDLIEVLSDWGWFGRPEEAPPWLEQPWLNRPVTE